MSGPNPTQIHELAHRLQTLEVDLHEAARSRTITEADYRSRLERLKQSMEQGANLKKIMSANRMPTPLPSQVDLPVMGDYTRIEQKIVARSVNDTRKYTSELSLKVRQVSEWAYDAATGSTGWIKALGRLSWLRRQIRRVDQDIERVRKARGVVEDFIVRSEIGGRLPNSRLRQEDLLAAFQEFEAATGRVTALRARLRGEISRNADMRKWLNIYSENRRQHNPEKSPPAADVLQSVAISVAEPLTGGAKLANERLVVARQLATALKGISGEPVETRNLASPVNEGFGFSFDVKKPAGQKTGKSKQKSKEVRL
ncbi:MAG: hypothetical protein WCO71_03275 [Pseudomonadota bacterium]